MDKSEERILMNTKRRNIPLNTATWYEQRIAGSIADYNATQEEAPHIGELRGLAEGLVRRLAELEASTLNSTKG